MKVHLVISTVAILFSAEALAEVHSQGPMTPLESEKLPQSLALTGACANVKVVEWRPTPGFLSSTSYSANALQILDQTCQKAVSNFHAFLVQDGWHVESRSEFSQSVSLMPADLNRHGEAYRNLNDASFRFFSRTKEYEDGQVVAIWGYHQRATKYIYIRNDVYRDDKKVNNSFKTVFAHELGHALSNYYGIYSSHKGNKDEADERLAKNFTKYLGLGE